MSTDNHRDFFVWLRKWIRNMAFRIDDEGAIYTRSYPRDVSVPPESSPLSCHSEVIYVSLSCLNWALSYVSRAICPARSQLSNSMPANNK